MPTLYTEGLWASRCWFKDNPRIVKKMTDILRDIYREFGFKSRVAAPIMGRIVLYFLQKEERLLTSGNTCEPPTLYETNAKAVRPSGITARQQEQPADQL